MARQIAAGIDIGTAQTKVVIAEEIFDNDRRISRVIGTGLSESRGLTRGYITDPAEVARSIKTALSQAEKMANTKVKRAYFSIGGVGLEGINTNAHVIINQADLEIGDKDLDAVIEAAEVAAPSAQLSNRRIINSIPIEYKIDGKPVWGRVEGLRGQKLEVRALFITAIIHHLEDIIKSAEMAGVEVIDILACPVAASFVTLSKKQRRAGSVLVDIGAETISVVVFENDSLLSLEILPTGSTDITHDIALGLKVTLEEAENIKKSSFSRVSYSKKHLEQIISARLKSQFDLVLSHLKKTNRDGLLPAGVILTGGGSELDGIRDFAESFLELPAHEAEISFLNSEKNRVADGYWSVASGLAVVGFLGESSENFGQKNVRGTSGLIGQTFRRATHFIMRLLP